MLYSRIAMLASGRATRVELGSRRATPRTQSDVRSRVTRLDRWLAARVQRTIDTALVRLALWDGSSPFKASHPPIGDLVVRDRRTLMGLVLNPDIWFAEAYMAGRLDIRGPFQAVLEALSRASLSDGSWRDRMAAALAVANSPSGARRNVHDHYDLGNDFYGSGSTRAGLHLRVLRDPDDVARGGAARQARSRVPQAAAASRARPSSRPAAAGARSRCTWRGTTASGSRPSTSRASRSRTRASARAREGLAGRVEFVEDDYRNVTRPVRRLRLGRHAGARRPAQLRQPGGRPSTQR